MEDEVGLPDAERGALERDVAAVVGELVLFARSLGPGQHDGPKPSILRTSATIAIGTAGFKHLSAGRAAIYNQLSTAFIIILAVLVLKERMTKRKLIGVTLALAGAIVVGTATLASAALVVAMDVIGGGKPGYLLLLVSSWVRDDAIGVGGGPNGLLLYFGIRAAPAAAP